MKNKLIAIVALSVAVCGHSFAADGQVNFTGKILDSACEIINNTSNPIDVNLGQIAKTSFTGAGSKASATKFTIVMQNCPDTVTNASVKFDGTSTNGDSNILALTQESGVATGVGIEISDASQNMLALGKQSESYPLTAGATNNLEFVARYIATSDAITAGSANSVATFTINYN